MTSVKAPVTGHTTIEMGKASNPMTIMDPPSDATSSEPSANRTIETMAPPKPAAIPPPLMTSKANPTATRSTATTSSTAVHPECAANRLEDRMIVGEEELLGSVTTLSSPAVRASARVIQKLRLDLIRPSSPPPPSADRSDTDGARQSHSNHHPKTPSHSKSSTKVTWTSNERNLFFDALCEYGKDFDAIANYVNQKVRRQAQAQGTNSNRSAAAVASTSNGHSHSHNGDSYLASGSSSGPSSSQTAASCSTSSSVAFTSSASAVSANINCALKTKEHVRLLYYQTFHKVTKYLRFSDDVRKVAQELYALINYGEMRKKLVFINHKAWAKLTELVYQGTVQVRVKGKNIRLKTPACKALRRLNQMEEWQEEIKLPAKVEVWLRPATAEAWQRVQGMAMNPRVRTTVPLQKRLVSVLRTMQQRWRGREARLADQTLAVVAATASGTGSLTANLPARNAALLDVETAQHYVRAEPRLRFAPPPATVIHRPMVNLAEFLSSYSICLNAYEERIGVAVRGERLTAERLNSIALEGAMRSNAKRQRNDSGSGSAAAATTTTTAVTGSSERRSPEYKRNRSDPELMQAPTIPTTPTTAAIASTSSANSSADLDTTATPITSEALPPAASIVESSADESDAKPEPDYLKTKFHLFGSELEQLCTNAATTSATTTTTTAAKPEPTPADKAAETRAKRAVARTLATRRRRENFRPLISEALVVRIMRGWCETDIGDVTVGDLYIMFGQDFKLQLEYSWQARTEPKATANKEAKTKESTAAVNANSIDKAPAVQIEAPPAPPVDDTKPTAAELEAQVKERTASGTALSNKLKQLLLLAGLAERAKEPKPLKKPAEPQPKAPAASAASALPNCQCGHFCDKSVAAGGAGTVPRSYISNKIYPQSLQDTGLFRLPQQLNGLTGQLTPTNSHSHHHNTHQSNPLHGHRFGSPTLTPAPQLDAYRASLSQARYRQNRWLRTRNQRAPSKQVVVQRLLPLQPGATQTYDVVRMSPVDASGKLQHLRAGGGGQPQTRSSLTATSGIVTEAAATSTGGMSSSSPFAGLPTSGVLSPPQRTSRKMMFGAAEKTAPEVPAKQAKLAGGGRKVQPPEQRSTPVEVINTGPSMAAEDEDSIANDPGIQSLMDISLPSPTPSLSNLDDLFSYSNGPAMSPMTILRQSPTDPRWFEENVNDFSLSSFLGQLDAVAGATPSKAGASSATSGPTTSARDASKSTDGAIETPLKSLLAQSSGSSSAKLPPLDTNSRMSTLSEASIDYMSKFEEIAQSMLQQQQQQHGNDV